LAHEVEVGLRDVHRELTEDELERLDPDKH
jgi:hypothetical protein